jgi:hypothetical protein
LTNELRTIANRGIEVAPIKQEKVKDVFSIHRAIRSQMANGERIGRLKKKFMIVSWLQKNREILRFQV